MDAPRDPEARRALVFDPRFHDTDRLIGAVAEGVLDQTRLGAIASAIQVAIQASPEIETYVVGLWDALVRPAEAGIRRRRPRHGDVGALHLVAAVVQQEDVLLRRFQARRAQRGAQRVAKLHRGAGHQAGPPVRADPPQQHAVQLDLVERQVPHLAEREAPGPEVAEGQPHAEPAKRRRLRHGVPARRREGARPGLKLQAPRRQAAVE